MPKQLQQSLDSARCIAGMCQNHTENYRITKRTEVKVRFHFSFTATGDGVEGMLRLMSGQKQFEAKTKREFKEILVLDSIGTKTIF